MTSHLYPKKHNDADYENNLVMIMVKLQTSKKEKLNSHCLFAFTFNLPLVIGLLELVSLYVSEYTQCNQDKNNDNDDDKCN